MAPRKPKAEVEPLPKECCGVCDYGHYVGKQYHCFGGLPLAIMHENGGVTVQRGFPIELHDFPCASFKPRMQS